MMAYGELMPRLSPCPHELIVQSVVKYCPSPKAVFDIGCGRGDRLRALGEAFPGAYMAGIDSDGDMVKLASDAGDIRRGYAENIPFEDGKFDIILCECSLSLFSDAEKSLLEAARLLKEGGLLILGELAAELGSSDFVACPDGDAVKRIYSQKAIEKMTADAGFSRLEFLDRSEDLAAMAAQMIFDGNFCACLGKETAGLLMKLRAGYGLWIFRKG